MQTTPAVAGSASCPHDRGPGTTICLRCRADSHRTAAAARQRLAIQAGIAVLCVAAVVAIGSSALASRGNATVAGGESGGAAGGTPPTLAAAAADAATSPSASAASNGAPLIGDGRTDLGEGTYAVRSGRVIVVHFDTPQRRTRRRDKFERVVRETLPAVYGTPAQHALEAVPEGGLITGADLLTELPSRGVTLPARDGIAITLYPGTRAGQDGPLAVRYRVAVVPTR